MNRALFPSDLFPMKRMDSTILAECATNISCLLSFWIDLKVQTKLIWHHLKLSLSKVLISTGLDEDDNFGYPGSIFLLPQSLRSIQLLQLFVALLASNALDSLNWRKFKITSKRIFYTFFLTYIRIFVFVGGSRRWIIIRANS